jgi:carnitine-CoA ligase
MTTDPRIEDLLSLVDRQAKRYGDKTFMTFGDGETMSFRQFDERIGAVRALLAGKKVAGEPVALMMKNSLFYPVAWLGIVTSGCVAVPINSRLRVDDARYVLEHSGALAAFADDSTSQTLIDAGAKVIFDPPPPDVRPAPAPRLHAGSLANIQYTSGTTGFPKGCLLTHRYWQTMGATSAAAMGVTEDDTLLTSQPFSYVDPQWLTISALRSGAHLVLLDGFHPSTFMADIARFNVTVFYCLGVMPTLLMKQPPQPSDREHSIQRVFCSAIPVEMHAAIEERWEVPWSEAFGMTETGMNTWVAPDEHDRCVGSGAIGRAVPINEAAIFDENDNELPAGEVGEFVLRGLGLMEGYHRDPEATAAFFRNGWAHTGDLATRDEDGFIYLRGRQKEMIRRGGENIAPTEVETALATHAGVVECAVAAVPDEDMGEEIKAYVIPKPGTELDPKELADHLRERVASFKVPRYWEFREELPHTPSERVAKHELERDRDDFRENSTDLSPR